MSGARTVSIDGKKTIRRAIHLWALTLSADGSRFAYAMGGINSERLVVDGVEQRGLTFPPNFLGNSGARPHGSRSARTESTSPTRQCIRRRYHEARDRAERKVHSVRTGDIVDRVTFTPDSKHLYWIAREPNAPVLTIDPGRTRGVEGRHGGRQHADGDGRYAGARVLGHGE